MQARRGRYFQMRRWNKASGGEATADCSFVRVCSSSDDPRFTRMMQDYTADQLLAAGNPRPARRALDPDIEAVIDPRNNFAWE